jgi:hypothetical protein
MLSGCAGIFWGILCPPKFSTGEQVCFGAVRTIIIERECNTCFCQYKTNIFPLTWLSESELTKCNIIYGD